MDTVVTVFQLGIALSIPILWASYGELIVEQAGVLNVGIEGVMLSGAFGMALGLNVTGNLYAALGIAIAVGILCGLVLSLLYVRLGTDQIVTGILFGVAAFGLTTTLAEKYVSASDVKSFGVWKIPVLGDIPYLGEILFQHNVLVYAAVAAAPVVFWLMRRTWFGLHARSAAEHPKATAAAGVNVWALRYAAVILGCALVAVGGAAFMNISGGFVAGGTGGRGFIAMAVVVLARWNPFAVVGAALLFGVATSFAQEAQGLAGLQHVPADFWLMLPYIVTIAAVVFARGTRYPSAVGVPYRPAAKTS